MTGFALFLWKKGHENIILGGGGFLAGNTAPIINERKKDVIYDKAGCVCVFLCGKTGAENKWPKLEEKQSFITDTPLRPQGLFTLATLVKCDDGCHNVMLA